MPGNKSVKGMAAGDATTLWRNARLATFDPSMEGIGAVENAVIAVRGGRIALPARKMICLPIWQQPMRSPIAAAAGSRPP